MVNVTWLKPDVTGRQSQDDSQHNGQQRAESSQNSAGKLSQRVEGSDCDEIQTSSANGSERHVTASASHQMEIADQATVHDDQVKIKFLLLLEM